MANCQITMSGKLDHETRLGRVSRSETSVLNCVSKMTFYVIE